MAEEELKKDSTEPIATANDDQSVAPLWSVDSVTGRCSCWGKCWFTALVIFSWIFLIALMGLGGYCGVKWTIEQKDSDLVAKESREAAAAWARMNTTVKELNTTITQKTAELISQRKALLALQEEHKGLYANFHTLDDQFHKLRTDIETATHQITHYTSDNEMLTKKNKLSHEQITSLTEEVKNMETVMKTIGEEVSIYKIGTYSISGVFAISLIEAIIVHIKLSNLETELNDVRHFTKNFEALAAAYEDYELLRMKHGKSVARTNCFKGTRKSDLQNCLNKGATITTIQTSDGYQFGAVFHQNWETNIGAYTDEKAYTFSDTQAGVAPVKDKAHAMIVDQNLLMEFGEGDIAVAGETGTVKAKSYDVPAPYGNSSFYYTSGSFKVGSISIDAITIH